MAGREETLTTPNSPWIDTVGIWTSVLCVIHCLATPFLLSFSVVLAHYIPSEERTHRTLAVLIALIGAVAILRGFRAHRRRRVLILTAAGMGCIAAGAWFGDLLPEHWMEVGVTFCGSTCMISAHRLNHTFCRRCRCADEVCGVRGDVPPSGETCDSASVFCNTSSRNHA